MIPQSATEKNMTSDHYFHSIGWR